MKEKTQKITVFLFCGFIFIGWISLFFIRDKKFSEDENRYLAMQPEYSFSSFVSGDYTRKFEDYLVDQFPFRSQWIELKAAMNYGTSQLESNKIYFGKEGYLIPQFLFMDEEIVQRNVDKMIHFQNNNPSLEFSWMIVPTKSLSAQGKLPSFSVNVNQEKWLKTMKEQIKGWIDLSEILEAEHFYKSDHHWNQEGSYLGYLSYAQEKKYQPVTRKYTEVSNNFKGTSSSLSGAYWYAMDSIYKIVVEEEVLVSFEDGKQSDSLFFEEWLDKKNQYAYYLDGNHPIVRIENQQVTQGGKTLLILKDSYAHNFVPYLISHYQQIILVDLRYYHQNVSDLVAIESIDEVLYLYGIETLNNPKNFVFLK